MNKIIKQTLFCHSNCHNWTNNNYIIISKNFHDCKLAPVNSVMLTIWGKLQKLWIELFWIMTYPCWMKLWIKIQKESHDLYNVEKFIKKDNKWPCPMRMISFGLWININICAVTAYHKEKKVRTQKGRSSISLNVEISKN